jgi:hypothetical protein
MYKGWDRNSRYDRFVVRAGEKETEGYANDHPAAIHCWLKSIPKRGKCKERNSRR